MLRRHHIAPVTFQRVMAMHAMHADDDTGRGCTIDVEHLRLEASCSERTVQRARAAARELGVATEVHRGRHLTLEERIEAYDRGSKQRGFASVYALGCPAWLAPKLPHRMQPVPNNPHVTEAPGERGTPPVGRSTRSIPSPRSLSPSAPSADALAALDGPDQEGGATDPAPWPPVRAGTSPRRDRPRGPSPAKLRWREQRARGERPQTTSRRRHPRYDPAAIQLASEVRRHVPALHGIALGRLVPAHTRFARAATHWTPELLVRTAFHVAIAKGWTTNPARVRHPAGWWAGLLDGIEPDLPGTDRPAGEAVHEPAASHNGPVQHQSHWARAQADHSRKLRLEHHEHAETQRRRERLLEAEARAERAGLNLCPHGAGGADHHHWSPRCALCRHGDTRT